MEEVKHPAHHDANNLCEQFEDAKFDLQFHIGKNLRYHAKRSAFFSFWNNANKILSYIIGSATIVAILAKQYELYAVLCNVLILMLSAFDSFVGFGDKARDYKEFYQAYKRLDIKLRDVKSREEITELWKEADQIELNEPNTLLVLMEMCWNEEAAYQNKKDDLRQIAWWQKLVAQYIDLCPFRIVEKSDKQQTKTTL